MKILSTVGLSIGLILIGVSFFAEQIGMDNDAGWGAGRILMLETGTALLLISVFSIVFRDKLACLRRQISGVANRFKKINYSSQMIIFSTPAALIVIASYVWFALPVFKAPIFNHYSLLANAFKNHQLHLIEEPPSVLLALDDPYDYALRKEKNIENFPWDASLYNNKFYFYWGPVPSLLLVFFGNEALIRIKDVHLVLAFTCGLFFYCILLSYSIWLSFNKAFPPWLFGISLLAVGLSAPTAWLLSSSRVYEAAISGCQFFFIGGCYWAYSSLKDKAPSPSKILLAGLHWALAMGTRITISPVIFFTTGMMLFYVLKQIKPFSLKSYLPMALYLCVPLVVAVAGLGWYNWARFGSILEFGIKYQLANVNYSVFHDSFSTRYIKENLYNYFIHPLKLRGLFPYLRPIENTFSNERLAGLVYISPYFLFAGLFVGRFLRPKNPPHNRDVDDLGNWLTLTLAGSSLISTLVILSFYFPATRYGLDFMPSLLLLATASLGEGYRLSGKNKIAGTVYIIFVALVALFSATASSLVAFPPQKEKYVIVLIKGIYQLLGFR